MSSSRPDYYNHRSFKSIDDTETKSNEIDQVLRQKLDESIFLEEVVDKSEENFLAKKLQPKTTSIYTNVVHETLFATRKLSNIFVHASIQATKRCAYHETLKEKCSNTLECVRQAAMSLDQAKGLNANFLKYLGENLTKHVKANIELKHVDEGFTFESIKKTAILTFFEGIDVMTRGFLSSHGIEFNSNEPKSPYRLLKNSLHKLLGVDVDIKGVKTKQDLLDELKIYSLAFVISPMTNCEDILGNILNSKNDSKIFIVFSSD